MNQEYPFWTGCHRHEVTFQTHSIAFDACPSQERDFIIAGGYDDVAAPMRILAQRSAASGLGKWCPTGCDTKHFDAWWQLVLPLIFSRARSGLPARIRLVGNMCGVISFRLTGKDNTTFT